ncbi:MAG TPA: 2-succinyl-5-enolpyruvyl-6-hydroxy-3-cyclohexene-1-carboxylic-acid synthase [Candidatus Agrococcus pullicola]|uniref:2-succinyl-5-enolpyruvyl-6-hydroxy-3-cyclohexene-1-carboxylate synthase n=1 Tax=Candidatus Agrococcus pullicola TaxID=2838429 RepID=A0A9D2C8I1_9MICO|nr:2-succinyl-5-enolpyruvyl-6-hydroxy-3-cyclohexene-1-carboxylic-acid synthase [Candidatus Agrococcus pullicola]
MTPERRSLSAGSYASRLIAALIGEGVTDFIVCPGSRSQALALAAAAQARAGHAELHVRIDERSAAFFALGLARETGIPAAVIVTSGTAVANLHPAVLEAHHSDVPLLLLTADRPAELQGTRANQTTDQTAVFGDALRLHSVVEADELFHPETDAADAVTATLGGVSAAAGPVQCNVRLREPLSGDDPLAPVPPQALRRPHERADIPVHAASGTLIVAGADATRGQDPNELARRLSVPLIAEPSSGARHGRENVSVRLLETELADRVRRVIVFGHPTLARSVARLLGRDDVEVVVAARHGDNVPGEALYGRLVAAEAETERSWLGEWVVADRALREADAEPLAIAGLNRRELAKEGLRQARRSVDRATLVRSVWEHTWPHDRLVLGASRLIRVLDRTVAGKAITVHSNRGLAGIDGTVSTALGVAAALDREHRGGVTRVLIGDVTALHDVGALLVAPDETRPRIQIVIGNDRGGTIFDDLEVAETANPDDFRRVQRTPHDVSFEQLAAAYGWAFVRVRDRAGLERALTDSSTCIVEVELAD